MNAFARQVAQTAPEALRAESLGTLQVNVGLRCNMSCSHCHLSCSPSRTEAMDDRTTRAVIGMAEQLRPELLDVTGGAPELLPATRPLLEAARGAGVPARIRSNLTALIEPEAEGLVQFLAEREVAVLASLPSLDAEEFRTQRGDGLNASVRALESLSQAGYGREAGLRLSIAVNPVGPCLPDETALVATRMRESLTDRLGIPFDEVVVLTNMPLGRFRAALQRSGSLDGYRDALRDAYNPATVLHLACRNMLTVSWDGSLADCDFNLAAGLPLDGSPATVFDFDPGRLASRKIRFGEHCFACAAKAGSG